MRGGDVSEAIELSLPRVFLGREGSRNSTHREKNKLKVQRLNLINRDNGA